MEIENEHETEGQQHIKVEEPSFDSVELELLNDKWEVVREYISSQNESYQQLMNSLNTNPTIQKDKK